MERRASLEEAKAIFGKNFIGLKEIAKYSAEMGIRIPIQIPEIPYNLAQLNAHSKNYLLVLGTSEMTDGEPLSLISLRTRFGIYFNKAEPCFYNQDWYMNEFFIKKPLTVQWYMLRKNVIEESRAKSPDLISQDFKLPFAVECAYAFFLYYFSTGEYLWKHDFVWCKDTDHNNDRIYVGRYLDISGLNNNGFSIHRHLALRQCYGFIDTI